MKDDNIKLNVTELQRFCMHDGPGIRTTVFLKGCPLRCAWCHNPETQSKERQLMLYPSRCIGCGACVSACPSGAHRLEEGHSLDREACISCGGCAAACPTQAIELCGREMTADEILEVVERDRAFYGKEGGITLSGGEPFMQGEKTLSLLREAKRRGLNVAVETCGAADKDILKAAVPLVDIFLYDVKDTDGARHKRYTGASFSVVAENLKLIDSLGAKTRLRCILLKGINTDPCHYKAIADLAGELLGCEGVELLPYHPYGASKAAALGIEDNGNEEWIPTEEDISFAKERIGTLGITVYG